VLSLASESDADWVSRVSHDWSTLLVDHAHCEKKAASTAINLIFRYQVFPELMAPLSAHAREELAHFELVLELLQARGVPFGPLEPSPYAVWLHREIRSEEPFRLLDTLLVCALIEARSCERMRLLADGLADGELARLYRGLLASEARHHTLFVDLATGRFGRQAVMERLGVLAEHEARVVAAMPEEVRMHSRGAYSG
jgi:tRNA 2-(methylsulfanyl)-N6-isopentenyladenosine37 hydroxylase